jgi:hypothetical protein
MSAECGERGCARDWVWRVRSDRSTQFPSPFHCDFTASVVRVYTDGESVGEEFPEETQQRLPALSNRKESPSTIMGPLSNSLVGCRVHHSNRVYSKTSSDSTFPDSRDEILPGEG